jgi:hypothetical protein
MRELLERRFAEIGARTRIGEALLPGGPLRIDVRSDRRGEYFDIRLRERLRSGSLELLVTHVDRADRHLLLMSRSATQKSSFLCGFDERHWFVAAVPESEGGINGTAAAKRALQPGLVRESIARLHPRRPLDRRNPAYIRQGEWFFGPSPEVSVDERLVLRNEPLSRGNGGRLHRLELAFRTGGTTVFVSRRHPAGISEAAFQRLSDSERRFGLWQTMVRDPELYAKGAVSHPDHATIVLPGWHRVAMNTEQQAAAMRHVVFID